MTVQAKTKELRRLRNRHLGRLCDYIGASNMLADSIKHEFDLFEADVAALISCDSERDTGDTTHDDTDDSRGNC
jgi:hypothetical protein